MKYEIRKSTQFSGQTHVYYILSQARKLELAQKLNNQLNNFQPEIVENGKQPQAELKIGLFIKKNV